ncbi:MAG: N-acetylmuramoyl-L-alanine amidase [Ruminococcaceae bacterium]|nr:N-acetylmuramoyl-L-alanine amidase [Oscillospiraceae bacterium]
MKRLFAFFLVIALLLCACGPSGLEMPAVHTDPTVMNPTEVPGNEDAEPSLAPTEDGTGPSDPTDLPTTPPTDPTAAPTEPTEDATEPTEAATEPTVPGSEPETTLPGSEKNYVILVDPGHQRRPNSELEPNGPGATKMKNKVSSGTKSDFNGLYEYELNLIVSLMLREELERRGYTVLMTRTTHDVNISNAERAQMANELQVDVYIRIHANGSDDPEKHGAFTICQRESNVYQPQLYKTNRHLAECVLDGFAAATGCYNRGVWENNSMTGINWCEVPNCILEMGYMSNEEEDAKLASEEYQILMVKGIADGLDSYFASLEE